MRDGKQTKRCGFYPSASVIRGTVNKESKKKNADAIIRIARSFVASCVQHFTSERKMLIRKVWCIFCVHLIGNQRTVETKR